MTETIIGVISDTHGLLRPEAITALQGSDLILHAGDIGSVEVLGTLRDIAPLHAVRGNIDTHPWAETLPETDVVEINGRYIYLLHNIDHLDVDPQVAGFDAVVFGHSHKTYNALQDDVLYFNPASAGPRRFTLPIAVGCLHVSDDGIRAEHIVLDV